MATRVKISMSPEEYLAGLRKLEAETQKSANKMENSFKEYGTAINKAGIAMRFVSSEMGATAVAFGRISQVIAGGKIAMIIAAITAGISGLKELWDKLTVSASEYRNKQNDAAEASEKNIAVLRKQQDEEDAMIDRLKELAKRETKTNEEKTEAARIAEILSGKYDKLGISIGDLTGDYYTLAEAIKKLNDTQNEQRETALVDQLQKRAHQVEEQFKDIVKPGMIEGFFKSVFNFVTFDAFAGTPVEKQIENFRSLTPTKQKEFAQAQKDKATTDKERESWKALLDLIEKQIDDSERLLNLRKAGAETQKEELKTLQESSDESSNAARQELADIERLADAEASLEKEREKAAKKEHEAYAQLLNDQEALIKANKKRLDDQRVSLRFMAMNALGMNERAAVDEALFNEANARGTSVAALDPESVKMITKNTLDRLALQEAMQTSTSAEMYAPRVNSLIARGGSAAPVKMPKVEELQTKQLSVLEKTSIIAGQILRRTEDWNTI